MNYETDVDRYVDQLTEQLKEAGLTPESHVAKTFARLCTVLKDDGFSLAPTGRPPIRTTIRKAMQDNEEYTIRAFRVSSNVDATIVSTIFDQIDGWKAKSLELKGRHYIVVSNAPRLSKKRIRTALSTLLRQKSEDQVTV